MYWFLIPAKKRNRCIFSESCSKHVYKKTKEKGLWYGLKALRFRYQNCRPGYQLIPVENETIMVTATNEVFLENEIDSRILNP